MKYLIGAFAPCLHGGADVENRKGSVILHSQFDVEGQNVVMGSVPCILMARAWTLCEAAV